MNIQEIIVIVCATLCLGAILGSLQYRMDKKDVQRRKTVAFGELLISRIRSRKYTKPVMGNDYDSYPGSLEEQDTAEFIQFLSSGILRRFGD